MDDLKNEKDYFVGIENKNENLPIKQSFFVGAKKYCSNVVKNIVGVFSNKDGNRSQRFKKLLFVLSSRKRLVGIVFVIICLLFGSLWFYRDKLNIGKKEQQTSQGKIKKQFVDQLPGLQKQVNKDPNNPALQQQLAIAKYATGDLQGAKDAYEKGVSLDAGNAILHNNLGNTYRDLKDYAKAESEYRQAMKLNAKLTTPYMNLASIYQHILGKPETALSIYEEGIKSSPDYVDFYNAIALIYEQQGLKKKSVEYFQKTLKVQPSNPAAQAGLKRLGDQK